MIEHINSDGAKPVKLSKPCKYCKGLGHLAFSCTKKPRKPMKARKSLSKIGKLAKAYSLLREQYFIDNPKGPYYCIYCVYIGGVDVPLDRKDVNVEHYHSKARHPELRFKKENLVTSCAFHNQDKGSLDGDEYLRKIGDRVGRH